MKGIIDILKKWNLWEKKIDSGVFRASYIKKIFPYLARKEIIVLKGVRRSGKSTIMKQLMEELLQSGIESKQILYLNLEEYGFADNLAIILFDEVVEAYSQYTKNRKKIYFFIDEIQKIPGWEKWVRTQYDVNANIKFIISGSSASLLSKELSTLLTGRNISFIIHPLSFLEYSDFTKRESVEEYIKFGGFPEVVLESVEEKKEKLLQQYFEDIIHKDIIDRYSIRNTKQIIDLSRYLVSASGSKVSVNKLSKVFGISKDTLQRYINYMIDAFILFEVPFFSFSAKVKHDVSKLPKLYCVDTGFISITSVNKSKNDGQMFETLVFKKSIENHEDISYWSDGTSEVDFVVEKNAFNVTATDIIPEREQKGLENFQNEFKNFNTFLITKSIKKEKIIPIIEFLKEDF